MLKLLFNGFSNATEPVFSEAIWWWHSAWAPLVCRLRCPKGCAGRVDPSSWLLTRTISTLIEFSLMKHLAHEVLSSVATWARGWGVSTCGLLHRSRDVTKPCIYVIVGISKYHPTWIALVGDELGSWWPLCWHPYLAAGFKHPKWSEGGDMAFQADIIMSGFATTVVGSSWMRVSAGGLALFCRWDGQSRGIPGTAFAPGHLPYGGGCPGGPSIHPFSLLNQSATSLLIDSLIQKHY